MIKVEAIEVLRACKPVYERFAKIPKYYPTLQEQECLIKFTQLFESGLDLIEDETMLKEAGIDLDTLAWLIGYSSQKK